MLRKLIRSELKDYYLLNIFVWGVTILSSVVLGVLIKVFISSTSLIESISYMVFTGMFAMTFFGLLLASAAMFIATIIRSTYQRLFSNFGVLTFSIPVKSNTLILSKYICTIIWSIGLFITYMLSILFLLSIVSDYSFFEDLLNITNIDFVSIIVFFAFSFFRLLYIYTIFFLVVTFMNSGIVKRSKIIWAIVGYIVITTFVNFLSSIVYIVPYSVDVVDQVIVFEKIAYGSISTYSLNELFYQVLLTIGGIFAIRYLIKNKLEIS